MTEISGLIDRLPAVRASQHVDDDLMPVPVRNPPAGEGAIAEIELRAGFALPGYYRDFLAAANGIRDFYFSLPSRDR